MLAAYFVLPLSMTELVSFVLYTCVHESASMLLFIQIYNLLLLLHFFSLLSTKGLHKDTVPLVS